MVSLADIRKALKKIGPISAHNKALEAELVKMGHSAEGARVAMESALEEGYLAQNQYGEITLPWKITTGGTTIFTGSEISALQVFEIYLDWRGVVDVGGEADSCVHQLKIATGHEPSSWSIPVKVINHKGETEKFVEKPLMGS